MRRRPGRSPPPPPVLAGALAALVAAAAPAAAELVAYRAAAVHPVATPLVAPGVLLVEDGRVAAVLRADEPLPAGARLVDLGGCHLAPGFVHAASTLGLQETESVPGTVDTTEVAAVAPDLRAEVAFHADSELLPVALSGGVLAAHVVVRGGLLSGTSAVMRLAGWNWRDMTLAAPVGMHLHLPAALPHPPPADAAAREAAREERRQALARVDGTFAAARAYRAAESAAAAGEAPPPPHDPRLAALAPVVAGELPLFLHARGEETIAEALDWARSQGLARLVLVAGAEAAALADRLAAADVAVVLLGVNRLPPQRWEPYDTAYTAPAELHAAGVRFAIADDHGAANARNLPFEAATAAAFGLPREAALAAITLWPAEILGVGDRLGSLAPGLEATFVATSGDPLEVRSRVERAWIAGQELALDDRQKRLWERYRERGAPASTTPPPPGSTGGSCTSRAGAPPTPAG